MCKITGCDEPVHARGVCGYHYRSWYYGRQPDLPVDPPRVTKPAPIRAAPPCKIDGCDTPRYCRGVCQRHYLAWHSGRQPDLPLDPRRAKVTFCSVEGCSEPPRGRGLCQTHWARVRRAERGAASLLDPVSDPVISRIRGEGDGYWTAHDRVRARHGRASERSCVVCGGSANEWALINERPSVQIDVEHRRYSMDPDDYQPMCWECHHEMDRIFEGRPVKNRGSR